MRTITLNIIKGYGLTPMLNVSQFDKGYTVACTVQKGAEAFTPPAGSTATVEGRKPDGTGYQYPATIDGSTVTFTVMEQMTVLSGRSMAEIVFYDADAVRIGTANFYIIVEAAPLNEETVISDTDLPAIIDAANANAERAEDAADEAEATLANFAEVVAEQVEQMQIHEGQTVIDGTLTVSGAAADAKVVGDKNADLETNLELITGVDMPTNWTTGKYFPTGSSVTYIDPTNPGGSSSNYVCMSLPCNPGDVFYVTGYGATGTLPWTFVSSAASNNIVERGTSGQHTFKRIVAPAGSSYVVFNSNKNYPHAVYVGETVYKRIDGVFGVVGSYQGAFTQKEAVNTGIEMTGGRTYLIRFNAARTDSITVFKAGQTSIYKRALPNYNEVRFTPAGTGNLVVYNPNSNLDPIDITVYDWEVAINAGMPQKYRVAKDQYNGDYTSLTQCLLDLKDNKAPKTIEIWGGDYDIYQEYVDANVPIYTGDDPSSDYFPYCVWVPENTHIIGKGIVRLKWMPNPATASITPNQCKCVSPLNVAASCAIENVEVYCKNGRYVLHNDGLGKPEFVGAVQKYINCKFYKYDNDTDPGTGLTYGFLPTTGFGIDADMHHVYENCEFVNEAEDRAFYGHTRGGTVSNENMSPDITLNNCILRSEGALCVKFGNSATNRTLHIRTLFSNCYIQGLIRSQLESSASGDCANAFDIRFLNCGDVTLKINDPDNPFTPLAFNTNMTIAE